MRVFVTGGTGHSGSYIIPELIAAGHEVTGLARSDTAAAALSAHGAKVRRGDLQDLRLNERPRTLMTSTPASRGNTPWRSLKAR